MIQAFSGTFSILVMCMVGYALHKSKFLNEGAVNLLTRMVAMIGIPCLLLHSSILRLTPEFFQEAGLWLLLPLLATVLLYSLAYVVAKLIGIKKSDYGVFCAAFSMPNVITIGMPITLSIFGEAGIPFMMSYYVSTNLFFWSFAVFQIAKDGGRVNANWKSSLRLFFSPAILATIVGIAISFSPFTLPGFLMLPLENFGNLVTPLSLIISGSVLSRMGKNAFVLHKPEMSAVIGRFVVSPLVCLGVCLAITTPVDMARAYVVQSGLPSMNQIMLMSKYYGANEKLGAQMMLVTTILSVLAIPLIVLLLGIVYR